MATILKWRKDPLRKIFLGHPQLGDTASLVLLILVACCPTSKASIPELRFTVFGDVHYKSPDYTVADYFVRPVTRELAALNPPSSFLLQTGDFFHADRDTDWEAEALYAFKHFSSTVGMPFYIAIGNHDKREAFEKSAFPIFSRQLDRTLVTSYYSFDRGNCHFIILDCVQPDFTEQLSWAQSDLKAAAANPKIKHIFAAGHYPLWVVARSGFTSQTYAKPFADLLSRHRIDAYFCGHTHNNTVTVRLVNGRPLTQISSCGVVEKGRLFHLAPFLRYTRPDPVDPYRPGLLPLEESRHVFIPSDELKYYWAYQEGGTSTYNVVTVRGGKVKVDWHVLDKGVLRSYEWDQPGHLVNTTEPAPTPTLPVDDADLGTIQRAWCYVAPWTQAEEVRAPFTLNGIPAGTCLMTKKEVAYSPFWNMLEIPLTPKAVEGLRRTNTLRVSNPGQQAFGLAHILLIAQLEDGRIIKTEIAHSVYASFLMTNQESFFPTPEHVRSVSLGNDLQEIALTFEKVIQPPGKTPSAL